uniref:Redoxin domain-containing protein n=1 Tax=Thermomicrobium roseum TaxID=500 RepID=A0A7C1JS62_THERO
MPIAPGHRLPDFEAEGMDGQLISTRRYYLRSGLVVVFTHAWPCAACRAYLSELDQHLPEFRAERMEVLAIVPLVRTLVVDWGERVPRFPIALAEGSELHRRFGWLVGEETPAAALLVADDTGTVWQAWNAGDGHELPDIGELLAWVRYVSYQCPECWETSRW